MTGTPGMTWDKFEEMFVEKFLIALVVAIAGFFLKKALEKYRGSLDKKLQEIKGAQETQLEVFKGIQERQLQELKKECNQSNWKGSG